MIRTKHKQKHEFNEQQLKLYRSIKEIFIKKSDNPKMIEWVSFPIKKKNIKHCDEFAA